MTTLIFFGIAGLAFVCSMFVSHFYETKVAERLVPLYLKYDHHFRTRQGLQKDEERLIAKLASGEYSKEIVDSYTQQIKVYKDVQHQKLNDLTI